MRRVARSCGAGGGRCDLNMSMRQMKRLVRAKARIVASLAQPLLFLVTFGFAAIFERAGAGNYIDFLAPCRGRLFPLDGLPAAMYWIVRADPLSYGVDALRALLINVSHFGLALDLGCWPPLRWRWWALALISFPA